MIDNVKEYVQFFSSQVNRERKRRAYQEYEIMMGLQKGYVLQTLQSLYPDNYKRFRIGDISIAKKVTEKKSRAYSQQPSRQIESGQETLDKIYAGQDFFQAFKEFDMIYNLSLIQI